MSPRTSQQNEALRQQKREQIMVAALELFAENGYHATSISDITKKAKISKGLLYNYFESKEQLLESIIRDGFERILEFFDPNHDGILTHDELIYFLDSIFEIVQKDKAFWRLYMSLLIQPAVNNTKITEEYREKAAFLFKMLRDYFARKGSKNPDADITLLHVAMDGVFFNYLYDDQFPLEGVKQLMMERLI